MGYSGSTAGTVGRIENCQVGVFLAYASARGRTLLDRELYLPQVWAENWDRRQEAGVPESVSFHTKGQLAQLMLQRAVESGVSFAWVAGDEVYGYDRKLRLWLERLDVPHVLAIKSTEKLWASTEKGPRQIRADRLVSQVDVAGWSTISTGDGAKGPRSLAGKPLAGFCATRIRRIQELYGMVVHVIRCNTHYFIDNRR